jgi:hypothetical protein
MINVVDVHSRGELKLIGIFAYFLDDWKGSVAFVVQFS